MPDNDTTPYNYGFKIPPQPSYWNYIEVPS